MIVRYADEECDVSNCYWCSCHNDESDTKDYNDRLNQSLEWFGNTFNYHTAEKLQDTYWRGKFGLYSGAGYNMDFLLSNGYNNATILLNNLGQIRWIDGKTKVLFIDFNTFNPSTILHSIGRIAFEMNAGGIFPSAQIKTWKLQRFKGDSGQALALLYVLFVLFVFLDMICNISRQRSYKSYFCPNTSFTSNNDTRQLSGDSDSNDNNNKNNNTNNNNSGNNNNNNNGGNDNENKTKNGIENENGNEENSKKMQRDVVARRIKIRLKNDGMTTKWHWIESINFLSCFLFLFLYLLNEVIFINKLEITNINKMQSFRLVNHLMEIESYFQGISGFLLYFRCFKYLNSDRRFQLFFTMFSQSTQDLLMFFVVLFVVFSGFGLTGFILFGSDIDDFRNLGYGLANMMRYSCTFMAYQPFADSSRYAGSFYWYLWNVLMQLILYNIFIAIITDSFVRVSEIIASEDEKSVGLFGVKSAMSKLKSVVLGFGAIIRYDDIDADGDGQITAEELQMKYDITKKDAYEYISRYDTDGDGKLNSQEFKKVIEKQIVNNDECLKRWEAEQLGLDTFKNNNNNNRNVSSGWPQTQDYQLYNPLLHMSNDNMPTSAKKTPQFRDVMPFLN